MLLRETLNPRASMSELLAVYLHFLRSKHGYSCAYVGQKAGAARQTVSHWESAYRRPDAKQVELLDELYGTGVLLSTLRFYAMPTHDSNWFRTHLEYEAKADVIHIYECQVVPGLLQSEGYARTILELNEEPDVGEAV